jgi:hypothetical protein
MRFAVLAALAALVSTSPLTAQSRAFAPDPRTTTPLSGNWTYSPSPAATEAVFTASDGRAQLVLKCARASRQLWISKPSTGPITRLSVWTSEMTRDLSTTYDPSLGRVTALLSAFDPLLDALAMSRARIAVALPDSPPVVLPSSPEVARIVEDCRV